MNRITELVERTSRTFALGIRQLPGSLERSVSVAYLLLRVSDYFEDNVRMEPDEKVRYLAAWADMLRAGPDAEPVFAGPADFDDATPDAEAARNADLILEAFRDLATVERNIVGHHVVDAIEGMARWVRTGPAFQTEADLDDYMFEVAGRVGLLLTDLFALRSEPVKHRHAEMSKLSVEFGLGLQTVNVIRGLSSDPARGWIFIPSDFVADDIDPVSLWSAPGSPPALALLDRLVTKALRHLVAARNYVLCVPRREYGVRVFCLLPLLLAVRTVERSRSNPTVYTSEVKLTREEVRRIARRARLFAASNTWIRATVGTQTA